MKILMEVWDFYPNTAYCNHTKASVRGFRESGAECDVLSIKPLIEKDEMALNKVIFLKKVILEDSNCYDI